MSVIDADAHVEEHDHVFAAPYWDTPALADRKPRVVAGETRPYFLIDDALVPSRFGPGMNFLPNPSRLDRSSPSFFERPDPPDSIEFRDPQARLQQMQAESIDLQVLYPTLFLAYPLTRDSRLYAALCRAYNNWLSDQCASHPNRFRWVAAIPQDDVQAAMHETRRAVRELGAVAVMMLGTVGDTPIGRPQFDPLYAELSALGAPLAVHTGFCTPGVQATSDNPFETMQLPFLYGVFAAYISMIGSGVFDRFPTMKTAYLEAGSDWVPYWTDRLQHYHREAPISRLTYKARRAPEDYLRSGQLYFSFEVEEGDLRHSLETVGADQLLFASDMPHGDRRPATVRGLLDQADLAEEVKDKLVCRNAMRFYGLDDTS